jgi:cysteine desulfurase
MRLPIYLDYMATTPVDPRVAKKMLECLEFAGNFGNPASHSHIYGHQAKEAVEAARQQVADLINADPREIIWTSGATEANNLAIKGAAYFYQRKGKHIITCKTEHKAALDPCRYLEGKGFEVTYLTPQANGIIDLAQLKNSIRDDTILISIMQVNNEIGVIQDIAAIGELTRPQGIIFHVDAAQSAGKIPIDLQKLNVDLISFSAHKVYGPKGIGALFIRRNPRIRLEPLIHGGGHEQGFRSGTLPTHQIVGMGEAFRIAKDTLIEENNRIGKLRDRLWEGIKKIDGIYLNGDYENRISGNLNVGFKFVESESLLLSLKDLAISSGSACTSASIEPSHVLRAIGLSDELAHSSIRFSIGRFTTEEEIDFAILKVNENVTRLRKMSSLWQ